jgi:RimJ/RimL family protein N-acetyltransferase
MDRDDDLEGPGWFTHIPIDYFVDKKGREHIFRFAGVRDFDAIHLMYKKYEPKRGIMGVPPANPIWLEAWVRHFFKAGITNLVVMDPDDTIVGHAAILPIDQGVAEYFMALLPVDQSAGIGGMLAVIVLEAARYLSFSRLWICVEKTNIRALQLHRRLGFVITGGWWGWDYELIYEVRRESA